MKKHARHAELFFLILLVILWTYDSPAQQKFSIDQILSPAYPFELVSAQNSDRIAWIEYERGKRNVYSAAAPDFKPVRLTNYLEDDGNDLSGLQISDDGNILVFVRCHRPNRDGWIANPTSLPDGSEQATWAIKTDGGVSWRVVEAGNPVLSPDGKWVLFQKDQEIYEVPVQRSASVFIDETGLKPLFRTFGRNSNFRWSPDSKKITFVSNRTDHSFIGVYDREQKK